MKPHLRAKMTADGFTVNNGAETGYDAASLTARNLVAWQPPRRSADAEILPSLDRLVGRARDIDRNNPIARGARVTLVDNIVGTGPRLSPQPDYRLLGITKEAADEWAATMQSLYCSWWWTTKCHAGDTLTGDQLAQLALGATIMNGDTIALPLWLPERGDGYATKLQMVEGDRLSNPDGQSDTMTRRGGVELDEYGMPLGYWIRTTHPGDFLVSGVSSYGKWQFVPRKTEFGRLRVIHYFDAERAPQTRGKPLLTTILPQLKNIDRYTRAEIDAAVANAMIAGIITTPLDHESIVQLFSKDHAAYLKARSENAVRLEGGTIAALFPGDDFKSHIPGRPNSGFGTFVENIFRIAAVGADLNYELLTKDFSKTTYTSGRMALLEAWRAFNRRRDSFGTLWLDPIYALFAEEVIDAGKIQADGFFDDPIRRYAWLRCKWIFPGRGWVDPVKEATGAQIRLDSNLTTLEEECAQQGLFWRDVLDQRAAERDYAQALGLAVTPNVDARAANDAQDAADQQDQQQGQSRQPAGAYA